MHSQPYPFLQEPFFLPFNPIALRLLEDGVEKARVFTIDASAGCKTIKHIDLPANAEVPTRPNVPFVIPDFC